MISLQKEDEIAKILSELSPTEYSSLMSKVDREKWSAIPSPRNNKYNFFSTSKPKKP